MGIDGSGKSSAIGAIANRYVGYDDVICIAKRQRVHFDRVRREMPASASRSEDYRSGAFAEAVRIAHALDFLQLYDDEVAPLLKEAKCIVADRWSYCAQAFAACLQGVAPEVERLLSRVASPDYVLWLRASPEEAYERICKVRQPNIDEHPEILRDFMKGYEMVLGKVETAIFRAAPPSPESAADQLERLVRLARDRAPGSLREFEPAGDES